LAADLSMAPESPVVTCRARLEHAHSGRIRIEAKWTGLAACEGMAPGISLELIALLTDNTSGLWGRCAFGRSL